MPNNRPLNASAYGSQESYIDPYVNEYDNEYDYDDEGYYDEQGYDEDEGYYDDEGYDDAEVIPRSTPSKRARLTYQQQHSQDIKIQKVNMNIVINNGTTTSTLQVDTVDIYMYKFIDNCIYVS